MKPPSKKKDNVRGVCSGSDANKKAYKTQLWAHVVMEGQTDNELCLRSPLRSGIGTVERVFQLNDISVFLFQLSVMFHVILHQLSQGGKLLSTVQVIIVSRVLDLNVSDGAISPREEKSFNSVCI